MMFYCFLFFVYLSLFVNADDFAPEKTLLIDFYPRDPGTTPKNFLFRGNMPVVNGTFAYSCLVDTIKTVSTRSGIKLPTNFKIVDISFLNDLEEKEMKIESDYFKTNSDKGWFHNRDIRGVVFGPPQDDPYFIKTNVELYVQNANDQLPDLMVYLQELLTDVRDTSIVIYIHCESGIGKTGEVSGSYYMKYFNMTFTDAMKINNGFADQKMDICYRNSLQWYCYYLYFIKKYDFLKCLV